ncbi:MAG: short-chain dehydrogenase, partial [Rhodospirillaceae bacterium]|nr:short-chain dehydrogenase [Rhodospirillaceae bacterium]
MHVMTVMPGYVATRMTDGMDLPPKLTARPEDVAAAIEK